MELPRLLAIPTTLFLIMGGWVIFRVEQLSDLRIFSLKVLTALTDGVVIKEPSMLTVTLILATITIALQIGQSQFQSVYEAFTSSSRRHSRSRYRINFRPGLAAARS